MKRLSSCGLRPLPSSGIRSLLSSLLFSLTVLTTWAQSSANGTITGRVLNTATQEYVRNAEVRVAGTRLTATTESGGYYRLGNVPAGQVDLVVTYPGAAPITATLNLTAGAVATRDFELALTSAKRQGDEVIELQSFVVESEREGQSKMIAEQRQSMNIKQVMSADNFGDMSEQNIGEFIKYLPGITIDYVETDTRTASMGGMDPKYGYVTLDGNPQASGGSGSFGGNDRQFEFESVSMNNIESIEVNKTLTADMWGDAPAGTVNLRTRSALDRKTPKGSVTVGFIGNSLENGFNKSPRHNDGEHAKTRPRLSFDYSSGAILDGKLGITFNGSFTDIYKEQFRESVGYDYNSSQALAAGFPLVNRVNYKDGPKITKKYAGGIKVDFQPFPGLRMTTAASYSWFNDFFANRNLNFLTTSANLEPGSSATQVIARNTNNSSTHVEQSGESTGKLKDNSNLSYLLNYQHGDWIVDLNVLYSRARERRGGVYYDTMGRTDIRLNQVGWTATRPDLSSGAWTIAQTSGPDWFDFSNWGSNDQRDWNTNATHGKTEQYTAKIDVTRTMDWDLATTYKFGLARNVMFKHRDMTDSFTGRYVGPEGNALTTAKPKSIASFLIDTGFGGGIAPLPVPDKTAAYTLYQDHPDYFTRSEANLSTDLNNLLSGYRGNQEDVLAGYAMQTSRIGKLQFLGGLRVEKTHTRSRVPAEVPISENPFATVTTNSSGDPVYRAANTLNYTINRWSRGMETTYGDYTDWLPSFAAKYPLTENLFLKLGYNKAIKRPDLNRTAGPWSISINDETGDIRVTIPNPDLQPERSERYSAMLEYYFEPAGTASIHLFQSNITNAVDSRDDDLTAAEVGITEPDYADYLFRTYNNIDQERTILGLELSYSQQLRFFTNAYLRALSVFATYTHTSADPMPKVGTRYIPTSASGGVTWNYGRWFFQVNGTWTSATFTGGNTVPANAVAHAGEEEMFKPRTILFVNARYKLGDRYSVFISGDRAYDSGKVWYYPSDGRMRQIENYGSQWSFGVRGDF